LSTSGQNPFLVAPVTARSPRAADPEPAPPAAPRVAQPDPACGSERAPSLLPAVGPDGELEDLRRELAVVIEGDAQPAISEKGDPQGRWASPGAESAAPLAVLGNGEAGPPRSPAGPPFEGLTGPDVDVLGTAATGALGVRIALGLAAALVIGIAVAVLLAPRRDGRAAVARIPETSLPAGPSGSADWTGVGSGTEGPLGPFEAHGPLDEAAVARAGPFALGLGPGAPFDLAGREAGTSAADAPAAPEEARDPAPEAALAKEEAEEKPEPKTEPRGPGSPAAVASPSRSRPRNAPGPVSKDALARALSSNMAGFDACVAEAVRRGPGLDLAGRKVTLFLTVAPSGSVIYPTLDDVEFSQSELGACFKTAARKLSGPAFVGEPRHVELSLVIGGQR
jgi:hypothetical protein